MNEEPIEISSAVPIFPLPEVVLFPRQVLPLHIFEPRYRAMIADVLRDNRVLGIALLESGYEREYFTSHAPIHRIVGVGRVIASEELADGKYNILLRGEVRAEIVGECDGRQYRVARIEIIEPCRGLTPEVCQQLRREMFEVIKQQMLADAECRDHYLRLFEEPLSLGELTDLIASGLPIVGELRQQMLAEPEACTRARMLLKHLQTPGEIITRARRKDQDAVWKLN